MRKLRKEVFIEYNPVNDSERMHGYRNVRWVENVSRGLRLIGFADEIDKSIRHKGWYTFDDGDPDETYRGVVYQLPAREGSSTFCYGYADPDNDGCAFLSFDLVSDKEEAARLADRFAEACAESERDYHRAWDAGRRYDDLAEDVKDMRAAALAIGREMREARRLSLNVPTICATLRAQIFNLYRKIQRARKERAELLSDYGRCPGFQE